MSYCWPKGQTTNQQIQAISEEIQIWAFFESSEFLEGVNICSKSLGFVECYRNEVSGAEASITVFLFSVSLVGNCFAASAKTVWRIRQPIQQWRRVRWGWILLSVKPLACFQMPKLPQTKWYRRKEEKSSDHTFQSMPV